MAKKRRSAADERVDKRSRLGKHLERANADDDYEEAGQDLPDVVRRAHDRSGGYSMQKKDYTQKHYKDMQERQRELAAERAESAAFKRRTKKLESRERKIARGAQVEKEIAAHKRQEDAYEEELERHAREAEEEKRMHKKPKVAKKARTTIKTKKMTTHSHYNSQTKQSHAAKGNGHKGHHSGKWKIM